MKASPRQQRLLLDLQDLDTGLARLRRKRQGLPERQRIADLAGEAESAKQRFMEAQRELDLQSAEIERIETDVKLVSERRARDEQLIAVSTSPKEAQALQSELDTLARRTGELEEKELEVMELQEAAQKVFAEAEAALNAVEDRRSELRAALQAGEARIDTELKSGAEERAGLAAEIQRDVLAEYEDLRARTGIGAARLRGNVSEASNMALTPAELSTIRAAAPDELVYCPGTGAILVRVDEE
ncbi:hypothetical protein JD292_04060 [Leucobacter sp. CSA2]|uniref:CT398-like coiled coil hairpin domain-containing protein n=1 Tax=Leucobacter edaphi TaxID=2796472 RepID=A0A934QB07_9MICO|nr:hypothetical protein [Leucobacter edaphi]MBK0421256.1 hypothetical protein [Leucobacter edaphi]